MRSTNPKKVTSCSPPGLDNYVESCHVSYSLLLRIGRDEYESYQVEEGQIVDNSQNVPDKGSREIQML
jgi:hypothetical protein